MWKLLPIPEIEIFKERSEILKKENKKKWDDTFQQREEVCLISTSLALSHFS
jgi:hypothetical protein